MPTTTNGPVTLAYEVLPPSPNAPPLGPLLLNGMGASLAMWDPAFLSRLAGKPAYMAGDCAAVLDAAGIDKAAVLGHSLGGMTAMRLAADHPDACPRWWYTPSPVRGSSVPGAGILGYMLGLMACGSLLPWAAWASTKNPAGAEDNMKALWPKHWERSGEGRSLSSGQYSAASVDLTEQAKAISCPTAVVCGTEDCFYPVASIEALHGMIQGSELVLLDGYNHVYPTEVWLKIAEVAARTAKRGQ